MDGLLDYTEIVLEALKAMGLDGILNTITGLGAMEIMTSYFKSGYKMPNRRLGQYYRYTWYESVSMGRGLARSDRRYPEAFPAYYQDDFDDEDDLCPHCHGDGWGMVGVDWDEEDGINGPYDGETQKCPWCYGSGKAKDITVW